MRTRSCSNPSSGARRYPPPSSLRSTTTLATSWLVCRCDHGGRRLISRLNLLGDNGVRGTDLRGADFFGLVRQSVAAARGRALGVGRVACCASAVVLALAALVVAV